MSEYLLCLLKTQWKVNQGKCGICGDSFNGRKDNELPNGKYAKKLVITRTYREGDVINVKVELTANHNGFFVFKLCPTTTKTKEVTQKCLNRFLLNVLNSNISDKYIVPSNRAQMFTILLKLPNGLTCDRCLFQWTYTSANNWGKCENGLSAVGCGPQETFRACADIRIVDKNMNLSKDEVIPFKHFLTQMKPIDTQLQTKRVNQLLDTNLEPKITETIENKCHSIGIWKRLPKMDEWCLVNCAANYCPPSHCKC